MKILIISRYFAPDNTVGAIRWTKFAKYLTRLGHDVTVYAMEPWTKIRDPILERDAAAIRRVFRIGHGWLYRTAHDFFAKRDPTAGTGNEAARKAMREGEEAAGSATRTVGALMKKLLSFAYHVMLFWSENDFVRSYRRYTRADTQTYDVVIGTWSTDSSLRIALDVKNRKKANAFVADFRDICVSSWPELTGNRDVARMLRKVYSSADLVTMVVPSQSAENRVPDTLPQAVLTNGFDREDLNGIPVPGRTDSRLHITYLGQIYPSVQDFTPLFRAVSELISKGRIGRDSIRIEYAGQSFAELSRQAASCGAEELLVNHGFVDRGEALLLERSSDILLFTIWDNRKSEVLPAKFLEYMMMEKPVLALDSGPVKDRLAVRVLRETNLGFAYEGSDPSSQSALERWLEDAVHAVSEGNALPFDPNRAEIDRYSYPVLSDRLSLLLSPFRKEGNV